MLIYGKLKGIWLCTLITAVFNALIVYGVPMAWIPVMFIVSLIPVIAYVVLLSEIKMLSWRLNRSFTYHIVCFALLGIMIFSAIIPLLGALIVSIGSIALLVFSLLSKFQLFWGLDDLIVSEGYNYPTGRVRWCFYVMVISMLMLPLPGIEGTASALVGLILNALSLVILFQYNQAVKDAETGF